MKKRRKLRRVYRTKKQELRFIRLKQGLSKLITNTMLIHREEVINNIAANNKLARRLSRRMTYSWPKNKDVAVQHYNKKYREEVGNLPITMTIKSSICWFDRKH